MIHILLFTGWSRQPSEKLQASLKTFIMLITFIDRFLCSKYKSNYHSNQNQEEKTDAQGVSDINKFEKTMYTDVICKRGCRLRAIIRLIISGLGFTFLVSGIVVSVIGNSETGKQKRLYKFLVQCKKTYLNESHFLRSWGRWRSNRINHDFAL